MRKYLTFPSTMLLSLLLVGAVFAAAFVPRNASADEDPRFCGPMDVAIALDDTGSMGGAIANIVGSLPAIIDQAQAASGPDGLPDTADDDLRLGYITFKDDVTVHYELTDSLAAVEASIVGTVASGGAGLPSTPGKVTGGQFNLDNDTSGGFNVQSSDGTTFKGQLQYSDKLEDIKLHSESMTALAVDPSGTTATFKGTAKVNGESGYIFKVIVEDNGEPGTSDSFLIVVKDSTNTTVYVKSGTLSGGNIQIH